MRQPLQMDRVYAAAMQLKHQPELAPFKEWLTERLEAATTRLRSEVSDAAMRRAQGQCQAFEEVLKLIEDSSTNLGKLKAK